MASKKHSRLMKKRFKRNANKPKKVKKVKPKKEKMEVVVEKKVKHDVPKGMLYSFCEDGMLFCWDYETGCYEMVHDAIDDYGSEG